MCPAGPACVITPRVTYKADSLPAALRASEFRDQVVMHGTVIRAELVAQGEHIKSLVMTAVRIMAPCFKPVAGVDKGLDGLASHENAKRTNSHCRQDGSRDRPSP